MVTPAPNTSPRGGGRPASEHLENRRALRVRNQRLEALFENAATPIWVKDLDGRYLEANQALVGPWGLTTDEVLGLRMSEVVGAGAADMTEGLGHHDEEVIRKGRPCLFREIVQIGDSTEYFATIRFPLFDEDGKPTAVCGIATNTTETEHKEAERAASERLVQTMAESSPDLFWVFGPTGAIVAELGNFQDVLGYSKPRGVPTFDELKAWIHPEDLPGAEARFLRFIKDGDHLLASRFRVRGEHDRWVHLEARGRAMYDGDELVGLVVTARNVTEQVRMEEELRAARDVADRANNAKSEFLSRVSHELRTPLNSILGFSQLLDMEDLNEVSRESVQLIRSAGEHLLTLVNEVLDLALAETGRLALAVDDVALPEVVSRAIRFLEPVGREGGITLDAMDLDTLEAATTTVRAHDGRLLQILINLLSNAILYNDPGGHVSVAWEDRHDGHVRIEVSDNGWGLAPEDLERVFEPLQRFPNPDHAVEGSGMGLSVVRQLTELMGGTVGARSHLARGSVFWVELPAA